MKRAKTLIVALTAGLAASLLPAGIAAAAPAAPAASAHAQAGRQTKDATPDLSKLYDALGVSQDMQDDSTTEPEPDARPGSGASSFSGGTAEYAEDIRFSADGKSYADGKGAGPQQTDNTAITTPDITGAADTIAIPFKAAKSQGSDKIDDYKNQATNNGATDAVALLSAENGNIELRFGNALTQAWSSPLTVGPALVDTTVPDADNPLSPDVANSLVAAAGDINGDGADEIAVAIPVSASGNGTATGFDIKVFGQKSPNTSARWTNPDAWTEEKALDITDYEDTEKNPGSIPLVSLALGDLNGDGRADLADAWSYAPPNLDMSRCYDTKDGNAVFDIAQESYGFSFHCHYMGIDNDGNTAMQQLNTKATVHYADSVNLGWKSTADVNTEFAEPSVAIAQVASDGTMGLITAGMTDIGGRMIGNCPDGASVWGRTCGNGVTDSHWFASEAYRAPEYSVNGFTASSDGSLTKVLSSGDAKVLGPHLQIFGPGAQKYEKDFTWRTGRVPLLTDHIPSDTSGLWMQAPPISTTLHWADDTATSGSTPTGQQHPDQLWIGLAGAWIEVDLASTGGGSLKVAATQSPDYEWGTQAWDGTLTQSTNTAGLQSEWVGTADKGTMTTHYRQLLSYSTPTGDALIQVSADEDPVISQPGGIGASATYQGVPAVMLNLDVDAPVMTLEAYHLEYSDPTFKAFLAAPPYFRDINALNSDADSVSGETSIGWSEENEDEKEWSSETSVGAYVSYDGEDIPMASFEVEAAFDHTWGKSHSKSTTLKFTTTYSAEEDTVVLGIVPADAYYYKVWAVNGQGNAVVPYTTVIRIPRQPITSAMPVSRYNKIAAAYGLTKIPTGPGSGVFQHTEGDPASYAYSDSNFTWVGHGINPDGSYAKNTTVMFGKSSNTQDAEMTTSTGQGTSYENKVSWKIGAGAFGVVVGTEGSQSWGGSTTSTDTTGTELSGQVMNLPVVDGIDGTAIDQPYQFAWHLLGKIVTLSDGQQVPYVTYYVDTASTSLEQLPGTPEGLYAQSIDSQSITFAWNKSTMTGAPVPIAYQILKNVDGEWVPQAGADQIPASQTSATVDVGNAAGTTGQWAIRAVCDDQRPFYRYSLRSPGITVTVPATIGVPVVAANQTVVSTLLDQDATLSVTAAGVPGGGPLSYVWQMWKTATDGSQAWTSIQGANQPVFTIHNVTTNDLGRYRCQVSQTVNGTSRVAYSNPIEVQLGQIRSALTLTATAPFGLTDIEPGDAVTITAALGTISQSQPPTGTITLTGGPIGATDWAINGGAAMDLPVTNGSASFTWVVPNGVDWTQTAEQLVKIDATFNGDANYASAVAPGLLFMVHPLGYSDQPGTPSTLPLVDASSQTGGVISPGGMFNVPVGYTGLMFTAFPDPGYQFNGFKLNGGKTVGASSYDKNGHPQYTVTEPITDSLTVVAQFQALKDIAYSTVQQVVLPGGRFQVPGAPAGVVVSYQQNDANVSTPDAPGSYDVTLYRPADNVYRQLSATIPQGLRVVDQDPLIPVFLNQPTTNVTIQVGGPLILNAPTIQVGAGTITYAWTRNGQPLAGNGSTLTINPSTVTDAGLYQVCVVRTAAGLTGQKCYSYTVVIAGVNALNEVPVQKIKSSVKHLYLKKGQTAKVALVAYGNKAGLATLTWKRSNTKVSVNPQRTTAHQRVNAKKGTYSAVIAKASKLTFKGRKLGTTKVTVIAKSGKKLTYVITVVKHRTKVKSVAASVKKKTLQVGAAEWATTKVAPAKATGAVVYWKTSNKKVATVDAAGRITALKKGTVKITAKIGGHKKVMKLKVQKAKKRK
jgi:hypothetical protein